MGRIHYVSGIFPCAGLVIHSFFKYMYLRYSICQPGFVDTNQKLACSECELNLNLKAIAPDLDLFYSLFFY